MIETIKHFLGICGEPHGLAKKKYIKKPFPRKGVDWKKLRDNQDNLKETNPKPEKNKV